jgi:hypothetical protein
MLQEFGFAPYTAGVAIGGPRRLCAIAKRAQFSLACSATTGQRLLCAAKNLPPHRWPVTDGVVFASTWGFSDATGGQKICTSAVIVPRVASTSWESPGATFPPAIYYGSRYGAAPDGELPAVAPQLWQEQSW